MHCAECFRTPWTFCEVAWISGSAVSTPILPLIDILPCRSFNNRISLWELDLITHRLTCCFCPWLVLGLAFYPKPRALYLRRLRALNFYFFLFCNYEELSTSFSQFAWAILSIAIYIFIIGFSLTLSSSRLSIFSLLVSSKKLNWIFTKLF